MLYRQMYTQEGKVTKSRGFIYGLIQPKITTPILFCGISTRLCKQLYFMFLLRFFIHFLNPRPLVNVIHPTTI